MVEPRRFLDQSILIEAQKRLCTNAVCPHTLVLGRGPNTFVLEFLVLFHFSFFVFCECVPGVLATKRCLCLLFLLLMICFFLAFVVVIEQSNATKFGKQVMPPRF